VRAALYHCFSFVQSGCHMRLTVNKQRRAGLFNIVSLSPRICCGPGGPGFF